MVVFTRGDVQYEAEVRDKQVVITRTVRTNVEHPEQSVTLRHYLTYSNKVYDVFIDVSANALVIKVADGREDRYSPDEIEWMFTGEGEEDEDESVEQIKDSAEYYMPNHQWDSKYVEKFLKHNQQDNVNHPAHYKTSSGLEAIDVIDAFTEDLKGYECTYTSQVLKYTLRWKHKNGLEDLEKANWYLTRLINKLKEAQK